MDHRWLTGLKEPQKSQEKERILKQKNFLHEIAEILENQLEEGTPDYDSPSWAYHQADRNGANRKLREVIKFLRV